MKVEKKELVERQFTPYQIIISIESEKDHNDLYLDIENYRKNKRQNSYILAKISNNKSCIEKLFHSILDHKK